MMPPLNRKSREKKSTSARQTSTLEVRQIEQRLSLILESTTEGYWDWKISKGEVHYGEGWLSTLGYSPADLPKDTSFWESIIHPDDLPQFETHLRSHLRGTTPALDCELRLRGKSGHYKWFRARGKVVQRTKRGIATRMVGTVLDITELRQTERALRELSGRLITSQEEERKRVARELHDNIGQELALLAVQAQRIDSGISNAQGTAHCDIHEVYKRIKDIALKVSNLSHRLHSSELEFLGLRIAVERMCRDFGRQYRIDVDHEIKDLPAQLNNAVSLCFYRIVQEAFQNVAKHSHATHVTLELAQRNDEILLKIDDDGQGFTLDSASFCSGLGLVSMRERMKLIGGSFVIQSVIGRGTSLQASVALPAIASPTSGGLEEGFV